MESIFTFHQANFVGRLETTFLAEVYAIEERVVQSAQQTPYLRIMLTQDDGDTIMVALAIGKFYHVANKLYKVGQVYCFPRGMFEIRPRNPVFQSWSSYPYDLLFRNDSGENKSPKISRRPPVENDVNSVVSSRHQICRTSLNADTDNNWRRRRCA
ncbi:uncharacterized protein LOC110857477 [Folsomia candida]|uniref:Uncharacterized protein n=1 Tax=Folsomia candida TaxID=158441 RepID=A0A226DGT4_FOLCA|nr:uncharacterized protein LOC110857477 [Folsomia candida]OXA44389.1 hypothetical protein Fcan01_20850 [Folsomia candida]